jgi:spore germination protein YaaH
MVKSALHTRTKCSTDARAPENRSSTVTPDASIHSEEALSGGSASAIETFDIGSFGLVRKFVEHVVAKNASAVLGNGRSARHAIDWEAVEASVADSRTLEQAIGRAVVIADQMCRGVFDITRLGDAPSRKAEVPFFTFSMADVVPDFGDESRYRTRVARKVARILGTRRTVVATAVSLMLVLFSAAIYQVTQQGPSALASYRTPEDRMPTGNAQLLNNATSPAVAVSLPVTTDPPAAAPPSLAGAPPLRPHEVFGFAPYWTLDQSAGFNVNQLSTIAYFSIDVNPDGTLSESGPGWNGFQSQDLSNLITRAHAAGDRVVLTVTCFDQSALDQLTSSTSAPSTLATALIGAIRAKNLDGVNLDFEGSGSADQTGLTRLVTQVSTAIHGVNPHYQVTMDTYASSAGDPGGFYNIQALAPAVDGFFVMEYQLNLQSGGSAVSPLTSTMFSDRTAVDQYLAAVPASKVLLGLPYFGIDWPTTDGTLTAQATGPATQLSYGQIASSGHPLYWDPTTDTAWTSYEVGTQWHETFFEDPTSLYDAAQLADANNLAGVGIWALGMDGDDPSMLSALLGFSPAVKDGDVGPQVTSQSAPAPTTSTSSTTTTGVPATTPAPAAGEPSSTTSSVPATTVTASTVPSTTSTSSTTTTSQPTPAYHYSGDWNGQTVSLALWSTGTPPEAEAPVGQLTGYSTNDPTTSCLMTGPNLNVEPVVGQSNEYLVVATEPGECANAVFTFTTTS